MIFLPSGGIEINVQECACCRLHHDDPFPPPLIALLLSAAKVASRSSRGREKKRNVKKSSSNSSNSSSEGGRSSESKTRTYHSALKSYLMLRVYFRYFNSIGIQGIGISPPKLHCDVLWTHVCFWVSVYFKNFQGGPPFIARGRYMESTV